MIFPNRLWRTAAEYLAALIFGGVIYGALETLFRGYTHPSMLVTGGLCFSGLYAIEKHSPLPLPAKACLGALLITAAELIAGCVCNLWLGWGVWDYSHMAYNLWGQICLPFSLLWLVLTLPAYRLAAWLRIAVGADWGQASSTSSSIGSPFSS